MDHKVSQVVTRIKEGGALSLDEALELASKCCLADLARGADLLRQAFHDQSVDLCSIVNASSGRCSEDCRFCAQSSYYSVGVEEYDTVDPGFAIKMARVNDAHGVHRFSFVTAGRAIFSRKLAALTPIINEVQTQTSMELCASMGMLTKEKAAQLVALGIRRYHCNLEASRSYFPKICTTHTWDEKVATLRCARDAGMEICCGGIIGMGESFRQRLELACELRELEVRSIPINILTPIPNTPFAAMPALSSKEILTTIAMFRFINPRAVIRMAGGRGILGDAQDRCFTSGANGAIVGDYLTTTGGTLEEDIKMFVRLGFDLTPAKMRGGKIDE